MALTLPCEQGFLSYTAFSVNKVVRVACQSHFGLFFRPGEKREKRFSRGVNISTTRQTSHANDFENGKSHAREKPLLAG